VSLPFWHATKSGQLVATVQDATSHRRVADATVEVLTTQRDVVATLSPDASGRVAGDLNEGTYVVRVSHPRYAVDERRVLIQPRRTVEITANLRAGSSTSLERTVNDGVRAMRRALRF